MTDFRLLINGRLVEGAITPTVDLAVSVSGRINPALDGRHSALVAAVSTGASTAPSRTR
jgi:hypothetical protein